MEIVLPGRVGIVCPHCSAKLEVTQSRVRLAILPFAAAMVAGPFVFFWTAGTHMDPKSQVLLAPGLVWMGTMWWIFWRCAPHLAQLRLLDDDESVRFPLELEKENAAEYAKYLKEIETPDIVEDGSRPEWTCPQCHERVPGAFEICWNCEGLKPGTAASNNRWSDRDA